MVLIIDILIFINIWLLRDGVSPELEAVLFLAHLALILLALIIDSGKNDRIKKLENTMEEHLGKHFWEKYNDGDK